MHASESPIGSEAASIRSAVMRSLPHAFPGGGFDDGRRLEETRLIAAASHDLRQPLQAIGLWIEILRSISHDPATNRILAKINETARGAESVVDSLLDIARLDMGAIDARPASFPVARLLDRIAATFAPAAREKGLQFRVRSSGAIACSDPLLLERIVANLVSNAIRYSERGAVLVGCRPRGHSLSIEVWDTGIGIPEERVEDAFREFVQIRQEGRERIQGAGLGLAIARRIAARLGHAISVTSRLGHGSCFRVAVPRAATQDESDDDASAPYVGDVAGAFVVFVDDEAPIREAMQALLDRWGVHAVVAASTDAAIAQLRVHLRTPDLLISDYRLRGAETGLEGIARMRVALGEPVPAMIVTGEHCEAIDRGAARGGVALLRKPIHPDALRRRIADVCSRLCDPA